MRVWYSAHTSSSSHAQTPWALLLFARDGAVRGALSHTGASARSPATGGRRHSAPGARQAQEAAAAAGDEPVGTQWQTVRQYVGCRRSCRELRARTGGNGHGRFEVVFSDDVEMFGPAALSRFDAICFNHRLGVLLTIRRYARRCRDESQARCHGLSVSGAPWR